MKSDTSVQPGAMVIKPFDALTTLHAMAGSACSNDFAIWAERGAVEDFEETHEIHTLFFDVAGISDCDSEVQNEHQGVDDDGDNA